MNKIRIIDLLNKIANGEEVPKKIKYNDCIYIYWNKVNDYSDEDKNKILFRDLFISVDDFLNDEVEILDEEDKIEKCIKRIISHNFCITDDNYNERFEVIRKSIEDNAKEIEYTKAKINELIDEVNKLKENKCTK